MDIFKRIVFAVACLTFGFSGTQVGTVTSMGTAAAVLGGMFWGKVYANASHKKMVIIQIMVEFVCITELFRIWIERRILYIQLVKGE